MKKNKDEDLVVWLLVFAAVMFALSLMFGVSGDPTPGVPALFR